MSMYDWFQENDISSFFNAFINKGDDLEVVIETITEDVVSVEFSTEIPLLGQRKKVALAVVPKAKEKQRKSNNNAVGDKPKASKTFLSWTNKALGEPWKKKSLSYIPSPKGERSIAYMELLPKFYKAVWPYRNSDSYFRNQFMTGRSRQYETNVKVGTLQQKLDFKKGNNPAACGKYFTTLYIPRASDVAVLSNIWIISLA